jgi:ATP-binding cassette subfamily B (MDR/TAP) protein 1
MIDKYNDFLQQAHTAARPKSLLYGVFFSTQWFCIYAGVTLAFWEGYRIFDSGEVSSVGPIFTYDPHTTTVIRTF